MAKLTAVDHDPFAEGNGPKLTAVDFDPFAEAEAKTTGAARPAQPNAFANVQGGFAGTRQAIVDDYDPAAIEAATAATLGDLPIADAPGGREWAITPEASGVLGALTAPLRNPLGVVRGLVDRGADFVRGIGDANVYDAIKRGTTDMAASAIQAGGDFIDRTVQQTNPVLTLGELAGADVSGLRDPLGARAWADQAAAVNAEIGADRNAAMARLERPSAAAFVTDPAAAMATLGERITTQGAESFPGFALALATRNPELGANVLGGVTGVQDYADLTAQGVDPRTAIESAAMSALVESAGEGFSLPKVMARGPLGGLLEATLAEGGQELPVSIAQTNIQDQATGQSTPIIEQILGGLEAAATGAGLGLSGYTATNAPGWVTGREAPLGNEIAPATPQTAQAMSEAAPQAAPPPRAATQPAPLDSQDDADIEALLVRNLLGDDVAAALGVEPTTTLGDVQKAVQAWQGGGNRQAPPVAPQKAATVNVQPYQPQVSQPGTAPTPVPADPAAPSPEPRAPTLGDPATPTPAQAGQAPAAQSAPVAAGADLNAVTATDKAAGQPTDDRPDPPLDIRYGKARKAPTREELAARETELRQRYAPAELVEAAPVEEASHANPGEAAEPVTPAVVAEAVQKSADNTPRNLKQSRDWLLSEIDKASASARSMAEIRMPAGEKYRSETAAGYRERMAAEQRQAAAGRFGYVTLDVPGDGKFKVINSRETLAEFRKKVEASPGFRERQAPPRGPQGPRLTVSDAERAKVMAEAETVDEAPVSPQSRRAEREANVPAALIAARDAADARMKAASAAMDAFPKGVMGITPDAVKASPEWQAAKAESDRALAAVQKANAAVAKARKAGTRPAQARVDDGPLEAVEDFRGVTRKEFLGNPRITSDSNARDLRPSAGASIESAPSEPFLDGRYTAKFSDIGVAVYDGDKVIASYDKWATLVVDKKYRRQGIGEEMVYQFRTRYPDTKPATHRTRKAQALQEKVWERITRELRASNQPLESVADDRTDQEVSEVDADTLTDAERAAFGLDDRTASLRSAVDAALGKVASQVQYLRSWRDLPQGRLRNGVESRLKQRGGEGQTAALFDPKTGDVYLFTDANPSPERAVFNVLHEIAGHKGLRAFLGKDLDKALDLAAQNPTVMAVAEAIALERGIDASTDAGQRLAVEEALAELAAAVRTGNYDLILDRYNVTVPQGIRERVAAAVVNFLRRLKALLDGKFGQTFSDADVRALLENAWQAAQGNTDIAGDAADSIDGMTRADAVAEAKRLGLPATGTTERIANLVRIASADPRAWSRADFDTILPHLSVHQDVNGRGNVDSILNEGLRTGMADPANGLEPGSRAWSWAKSYAGGDAYVFLSGGLKYQGAGNPRLAPGNKPLFHVRTEKGGSLFDAIQRGDVTLPAGDTAEATAPDQTKTPEFRRWFAGSKVVDANGEPLVVYHGAPDARFMDADATFMSMKDRYGDRQGVGAFWFAADRATANSYADDRRAFDYQNAEPAIIAAYLKLENPLIVDGAGKEWREAQAIGKTANVIDKAQADGHDGVIIRNVRDHYNNGPRTKATDTYVVFDSRQIKSADRNRGTFDPDSPSILESVAEAEGRAEQRRNQAAGELPVSRGTPGWHYDESRWEGRAGAAKRARMELQDKMLAWRDVQNQVEGQIGRAIPDAQNVYRAETLMHGRVAERLDRIERDEVKPLLEAMKAAKVTPEALEEYLYARHAKERNAKIAAINPAMPEGGSGMTDAAADAILAGADAARLGPLADRVDAIIRNNRRRLLGAGLITPEAHDAMEKQYQHYVPLRGHPDATDLGGTAGRGIDTRRAPVKQALGRRSRAVNILGEVIGDAQRGVILAEKARVGKAVMRLVLANPNPDLWTVEPVQTERAVDANGEVYERVVNDWSDPSVVAVRVAGKLYKVQIQQPQLAQALNNVGVDQLGAVTRAAGAINRYFSAVLTKYNPAFVPVNATRDALFGLTGLAVEKGEAVALDAALHYPQAILAAGKHAAGVSGSGQWDQWAREFAEAGGKTGYVAMPSVEDLQRQVANVAVGGSRARLVGAVKPLVDTIGVMNDAVENALRLSAYVSLRKRGESAEAAAEYAKNLTVNFNRKGFSGSKLNAWFLFYNAALQGAHRTSKLLRQPKTYAYLGALAGAQVIAAMFAMGLEDDEGEPLWNKVPDHVKRRNLVIVHPSGTIVTVPMPYGFNLFTYMAGRSVDALMSKERKASNSAAAMTADLLSAASESFVPVPIGDGALGFLPTVLRIPTNIQTNRNDFGRAIRTEQPYAKSDVPRASMGRPDTLELFKLTATGLNRLGGGDAFTPPPLTWFDFAPEDLEYLVGELTGGTGKFVVDVATVGQQATGGKMTPDLQAKDIPITKRFVTNIDEQASQRARFYERRESIDRGLKRVRNAYRMKGPEAAEALLAAMPELSGATFKRRKRDSDNGEAGSIIEVDGSPQIIPSGEDTVFGAYKAAEKAMSGTRERIEDAFTLTPAGLLPSAQSRQRDASIRTQQTQDQYWQSRFNALWVRDVVGATEKSDAKAPDKPVRASLPESRRAEYVGIGARGAGSVAPDVLKGAKNAPKLVMVGDWSGLPRDVAETFDGGAVGAYDPNTRTAYVAMGMGEADAKFVAYHEIAGHHGLRGALGDGYEDVLNRAMDNPTVKKLAEAMLTTGYADTPNRLARVEEALADLAAARRSGDYARLEQLRGVKIPAAARPGVEGMLNRVVQLTKRKLADLVGDEPKAFNDEQVYSLIEDAWQYVERGP